MENFEANKVSFDLFRKDPWAIINDPRLVVNISGRFHRWKEAGPMLMSSLIFSSPLEQECSPVQLRN